MITVNLKRQGKECRDMDNNVVTGGWKWVEVEEHTEDKS